MHHVRMPVKFGVLITAVALVLSACGGGGDGGPTEGSKTLTVAAPGVVSNLDSEQYQGFISIDLLPSVAGTLVRFDKAPADATTLQTSDQVEPELAESWTVSPDGKSVDFVLGDAKSPFGNSVTSADVEWSINRMVKSTGVPIAKILMGIGNWDIDNPITVKDDKHFTIHLLGVNAVSVSIMSTFFMTIYDSVEAKKHATSADPFAYDWLAQHTASFGRYTVKSFDPGKQVRLVANKNYFRGQPKIGEVVIQSVPEESNRLQLIKSGDVDVTWSLPFDQQTSLKASNDVVLNRMLYPSITTLELNVNVKPFNDPRIRQALSYAIDRDVILKSAYKDFGTVSKDFFHDDFGVEGVDGVGYDPAKAKSILADAGYPDGFPMTLAYNIANVGAESEQIAVLLRSQLEEAGINVKLNNIASGADFDADKRAGKLTSWLATSLPLVPDPAYYLSVFYKTAGLTNQSGYSNQTVDDAAESILATQPGADRDAQIKAVDEYMVSDMPKVPLIDSQKYFEFRKNVTGFYSTSQGNIDFWSLDIK